MPAADTVLLDLDGTLVDSAPGILGSLRAAFDELDLPWPDIGTEIVGPPMYRSLPGIVGAEDAPRVLATYRRIYADGGLLDSPPYPGVPEMLTALADAGLRLAVATSKAEPYAVRIVAQHGWEFATVCGDTLDAGRPAKADVIAEAVRRIGPARAVMVGDRAHDVAGARAHGLDCHGAGWGYGAPGELADAGALTVHPTPAELTVSLVS